MTIKLAKFFNSFAANEPIDAGDTPPPLPPPNVKQPCSYYAAKAPYKRYLPPPPPPPARATEALHYEVDVDDEEEDDEDSMSLYSQQEGGGGAVMTTRAHPFNNSQRPLLAERKPPPQLLQKKKLNLKLNTSNNVTNGVGGVGVGVSAPQRPYISPYVQVEKRDSAKGLHGFNDFDILSQHYNAQLQSPHIGYPYGSSPSPTALHSDFTFDATPAPVYSNIPTPLPAQWPYGATPTVAIAASRFEDDFCTRRNAEFAAQPPPLASGPFIFGVPLEQQVDLRPAQYGAVPPGGRGFGDDNPLQPTSALQQQQQQKQPQRQTQATTSDTSTSNSHDSSASSGDSAAQKGAKFLLRKRKTKKNAKDKQQCYIEAASTTTTTTTTSTASQRISAVKPSLQKPTIKCVVVGDGAVGKTNLILSYLGNRFNPEHVPTASDIYNADVMVNDSPVHLTLCDTAGQDTLDPLRELSYPDSDVFLLCFSIAKPETYHAIKTKWAPKFAKTKAALILVGTQADLRADPHVLQKLQSCGEQPIAYADAYDLATTIGAKYIETSSATQDKVKEVFDTAIWEGLVPTTLPPTPKRPLWKRLCCLA